MFSVRFFPGAAGGKSSALVVDGSGQTAIPAAHQTRHTVLRVAEGHPGPGVVGPVPVVLRGVLRRLLDIVHQRVQSEVAVGQRLKRRRRSQLAPDVNNVVRSYGWTYGGTVTLCIINIIIRCAFQSVTSR